MHGNRGQFLEIVRNGRKNGQRKEMVVKMVVMVEKKKEIVVRNGRKMNNETLRNGLKNGQRKGMIVKMVVMIEKKRNGCKKWS